MKKIFLCSTKYGLMNSILTFSSVSNANSVSDLIIFRRTKDFDDIYKKLAHNNIFRSISLFDSFEGKSKISLILIYLFPKFSRNFVKIASSLKSLSYSNYDEIYSQNWLYAAYLALTNPRANIFFIEEGLSSYTSRVHKVEKRSIFYKVFSLIFYKGKLHERIKGIYLHKPEYLKSDLCAYPIKNTGSDYSHYINIMKQIFSYEENLQYKNTKYIYLGVPFFGLRDLASVPSEAPEDYETVSQGIVEKIFHNLSPLNVLYRKHPLEKVDSNTIKKKYGNHVLLDEKNKMWEMQCQGNIKDQHVIISFFSTAAFSPKLVFNREPIVIFLHKMIGINLLNADAIIDDLRTSYTDPSKVFEPTDLDSLMGYLDNLHERQI